MHIAHLVTRFLRSGSEENTIETCRWQVNAGHQVTLVVGAEMDPWWMDNAPDGVNLVSVPQMIHPVRPLADVRAYRALRDLLRQSQPDVVHTHQSKAGILGRAAAAATPGAMVVHGIHILPFVGVHPAKRAVYLAAERMAARRTDLFLGVSGAVCDAYISEGIARQDRTFCVRSGMDLDRYRNSQMPKDWRSLLGIAPGDPKPPVVLMLAALEPRKRHAEFLRAFAAVAPTCPELKILMAGAGPAQEDLKMLIAQLGLQDHVKLCGHRTDPENLLHLSDFTVLTSKREGLPRVVIQSLVAGRPVVINDLPGLSEVLACGTNAVIHDKEDLTGVAHTVSCLGKDPTLLHRLQSGAQGTDVTAWSLNALGAETTRLYKMGRVAA